jgi:hypothetical protein
MQQVTKFQAKDGRLFDSQESCGKHESMLLAVEKAIGLLEPVPQDDGCKFANGGGYVQQDMMEVHESMREVVEISGVNIDKCKIDFMRNPFPYRNSIIGRYLSDGDNNAVYAAWCRFMCMDDLYREWGQPYYAANPNAGEQRPARWNRRSPANIGQHG